MSSSLLFSDAMGIVAGVIGAYSSVPYITAILKGRTKPHQFSWLVFVIMNGIVLLSQFLEGARGSVVITLTFFLGSLIVYILSLKYGVRDSSRWDRALLLFALGAIAIWIMTRSNATAIWLTLLIDLAATAMILLKIRAQPKSEDPKPWILGTIAYIFTCLALVGVPFGILYVRPFYGLVCDAALVFAIYYFLRKSKKLN